MSKDYTNKIYSALKDFNGETVTYKKYDLNGTPVNSTTWSRVLNVISINVVGHGLHDQDTIYVTSSASYAPANRYTVTYITADSFSIVGLDAGATSGTTEITYIVSYIIAKQIGYFNTSSPYAVSTPTAVLVDNSFLRIHGNNKGNNKIGNKYLINDAQILYFIKNGTGQASNELRRSNKGRCIPLQDLVVPITTIDPANGMLEKNANIETIVKESTDPSQNISPSNGIAINVSHIYGTAQNYDRQQYYIKRFDTPTPIYENSDYFTETFQNRYIFPIDVLNYDFKVNSNDPTVSMYLYPIIIQGDTLNSTQLILRAKSFIDMGTYGDISNLMGGESIAISELKIIDNNPSTYGVAWTNLYNNAIPFNQYAGVDILNSPVTLNNKNILSVSAVDPTTVNKYWNVNLPYCYVTSNPIQNLTDIVVGDSKNLIIISPNPTYNYYLYGDNTFTTNIPDFASTAIVDISFASTTGYIKPLDFVGSAICSSGNLTINLGQNKFADNAPNLTGEIIGFTIYNSGGNISYMNGINSITIATNTNRTVGYTFKFIPIIKTLNLDLLGVLNSNETIKDIESIAPNSNQTIIKITTEYRQFIYNYISKIILASSLTFNTEKSAPLDLYYNGVIPSATALVQSNGNPYYSYISNMNDIITEVTLDAHEKSVFISYHPVSTPTVNKTISLNQSNFAKYKLEILNPSELIPATGDVTGKSYITISTYNQNYNIDITTYKKYSIILTPNDLPTKIEWVPSELDSKFATKIRVIIYGLQEH